MFNLIAGYAAWNLVGRVGSYVSARSGVSIGVTRWVALRASFDRKSCHLYTSDTVAEREENELLNPLEMIWGRCVLPHCGVNSYVRHIARRVNGSSFDDREPAG